MIRAFFKDAVFYGISQILFFGVPILLAPVYSHYLSTAEFGGLELLQVSAILVNFLVVFEIGQGLARFYTQARSDSERKRYASTAMWYVLCSYAVFVSVGLGLQMQLSRLLLGSEPEWLGVYRLAIVGAAGTGIFLALQNQLRWDFKAKSYAASALIYILVSTAVSLIGLIVKEAGFESIFWGQIAGAIAGAAFAFGIGRRRFGRHFSSDHLREMLAFSFPLAFSAVAVFFASFLDRFSIRYLMNLDAVAVYAIGFRFSSVVNVAFMGVGYAITPLIYRDFDKPETPLLLARLFRYFTTVALFGFVALSLSAEALVKKLTPSQYHSGWTLVPILALSAILARMYVFTPGLEIAKKTRQIAAINIGAALINIAVNFIFIPSVGIVAAALGTLLASLFMASAYFLLSQKNYPAPFAAKRFVVGLVFCLVVLALDQALAPRFELLSLVFVATKTGFLLLTIGVLLALFTTAQERAWALGHRKR